jgi:hypothetical protein
MKNLVDIDASNTHSERLIFDYWYEETRNTDRGNYYVYRIFGYNPFNIVWVHLWWILNVIKGRGWYGRHQTRIQTII